VADARDVDARQVQIFQRPRLGVGGVHGGVPAGGMGRERGEKRRRVTWR
jgi:hypothetical protein